MQLLKFIVKSSLLILLFSEGLYADCRLPETENIFELIEEVGKRDGWKERMDKHTEKISRYKYPFTSKMDSLYHIAIQYFEERLPEEVRCSQLDVKNTSWLSIHKYRITMTFDLFLDPQGTDRNSDKITTSFTYSTKTNSIFINNQKRDFWIPNCIEYPDSCKFAITSTKQAIQMAKELGYVGQRYHTLYSGSNNIPPFHIEIPKYVNDDCGMQSLYLNVYNKDTIHSPIYKMYSCPTLQEKIDFSDLVIEGTVIAQGAFSADGNIYSTVDIEVHHLFKGKMVDNTVTAIALGGRLGNRFMSISHGQISLGEKETRSIFFLNRSEKFAKKLAIFDSLLYKKVYFNSRSPLTLPIKVRLESIKQKTTEEQFQRIESITKIKRERRIHPQTWDEEVLSECKSIPDRTDRISARLNIASFESMKDSIGLFISLAGANDFYYLKNWELELSYDSLAFGTWLAKKEKVRLLNYKSITKELFEYYNFTVTDKTATSLLFRWERKEDQDGYIELPFLDSNNAYGFPILKMKIAILDTTQNMNLALDFPNAPIAHDFHLNKNFEIKNHYTSKTIKKSSQDFEQPIISNFYPKEASIGDTITMEGKYFTNSSVMLFGKSYSNRSFFKPIHKKFLVAHSDNRIVFIIPPYMQAKMREDAPFGEAYIPITKYIHLSKPKTYKSGASTAEELIIK